ncbi:MAG TPA: hypothetical protein PLF13_10935 [candidate division Zixibacteria bacterium]|nr:hypothetical protein [candidate division Zixibacteria bacterium]
MLKAIETGHVTFLSHLKECKECRELFRILSEYQPQHTQPLTGSSESTIARVAAIPLLQSSHRPEQVIQGQATADSWAQLPAMQLREAPVGLERRICFKAGDIMLELSAERRSQGWEFVARVYDKDHISLSWVLKSGRQRFTPEKEGFFFWKAKNPPKSLSLISGKSQIEFDNLSWKASLVR